MSEIVRRNSSLLGLPGVLSATGYQLPDGLAFDEWENIGGALRQMESGVMWWIGDWLRYGERRYGEMYAQALDATDYSYTTLAHAKWVSEQFEFCSRLQNVSWAVHQEAARLPDNERAEFLAAARAEQWTRSEARTEVNRRKNVIGALPSGDTCTVSDLNSLIESGQRFGTIYADPPWLYDNQGTRAATGNHYEGLTVDQLCGLPIAAVAAADAHLHLWTTNGFLFDCDRIMREWGFEFRSSFVWVKSQIGIGNYWRNSHEFLLTGIRGNAKRFADKSLRSWLECDRGAHSAKPEQARQYIERASPGPRLELFGRSPATGWTVWGNQIERGLFYQNVPEVTA